MQKKLTDKTKSQIVLALLEKDTFTVGKEFGLDRVYKGATSVRNVVYRCWLQAKAHPSRFGLSIEQITDIQAALNSRLPTVVREAAITEKKKVEAETVRDFKDLAIAGRNKAYEILLRKLDRVGRNNKNLDEVNLSTLATTFGIMFDKAQIASGEATENVALLAKVDPNMKPEEALAMVLRMREVNQEAKNTRGK